jgi:hypothetical protein
VVQLKLVVTTGTGGELRYDFLFESGGQIELELHCLYNGSSYWNHFKNK